VTVAVDDDESLHVLRKDGAVIHEREPSTTPTCATAKDAAGG
jgi:hypothetical protein